MDDHVRRALFQAVKNEKFSSRFGMKLCALDDGFAAVEMTYTPETMNNIYERAHGGAIFSLIDESFQAAVQTDGTVGVALNVSVTYVASPKPGVRLRSEAREISRTRKTISFDIRVVDGEGQVMATCMALAYRTGKPIPFL